MGKGRNQAQTPKKKPVVKAKGRRSAPKRRGGQKGASKPKTQQQILAKLEEQAEQERNQAASNCQNTTLLALCKQCDEALSNLIEGLPVDYLQVTLNEVFYIESFLEKCVLTYGVFLSLPDNKNEQTEAEKDAVKVKLNAFESHNVWKQLAALEEYKSNNRLSTIDLQRCNESIINVRAIFKQLYIRCFRFKTQDENTLLESNKKNDEELESSIKQCTTLENLEAIAKNLITYHSILEINKLARGFEDSLAENKKGDLGIAALSKFYADYTPTLLFKEYDKVKRLDNPILTVKYLISLFDVVFDKRFKGQRYYFSGLENNFFEKIIDSLKISLSELDPKNPKHTPWVMMLEVSIASWKYELTCRTHAALWLKRDKKSNSKQPKIYFEYLRSSKSAVLFKVKEIYADPRNDTIMNYVEILFQGSGVLQILDQDTPLLKVFSSSDCRAWLIQKIGYLIAEFSSLMQLNLDHHRTIRNGFEYYNTNTMDIVKNAVLLLKHSKKLSHCIETSFPHYTEMGQALEDYLGEKINYIDSLVMVSNLTQTIKEEQVKQDMLELLADEEAKKELKFINSGIDDLKNSSSEFEAEAELDSSEDLESMEEMRCESEDSLRKQAKFEFDNQQYVEAKATYTKISSELLESTSSEDFSNRVGALFCVFECDIKLLKQSKIKLDYNKQLAIAQQSKQACRKLIHILFQKLERGDDARQTLVNYRRLLMIVSIPTWKDCLPRMKHKAVRPGLYKVWHKYEAVDKKYDGKNTMLLDYFPVLPPKKNWKQAHAEIKFDTLKHSIELSQPAKTLIALIHQANLPDTQCFVAGGMVRDNVINYYSPLAQLQPKDCDIATNLTLEELGWIFESGEKMGLTVKLASQKRCLHFIVNLEGEQIEVISFPGEVGNVSQALDALRRDFYINACYYDSIKGKIAIPAGAKQDFDKKQLRLIGDKAARIKSDPGLIFRGFYLAAKLGFTLEEETIEAFKQNLSEVNGLNYHRKLHEVTRLLTPGSAEKTFEITCDYGLWPILLGASYDASLNNALSECVKNIDSIELLQAQRLALWFASLFLKYMEKELNKRNEKYATSDEADFNLAAYETIDVIKEKIALNNDIESLLLLLWQHYFKDGLSFEIEKPTKKTNLLVNTFLKCVQPVIEPAPQHVIQYSTNVF